MLAKKTSSQILTHTPQNLPKGAIKEQSLTSTFGEIKEKPDVYFAAHPKPHGRTRRSRSTHQPESGSSIPMKSYPRSENGSPSRRGRRDGSSSPSSESPQGIFSAARESLEHTVERVELRAAAGIVAIATKGPHESSLHALRNMKRRMEEGSRSREDSEERNVIVAGFNEGLKAEQAVRRGKKQPLEAGAESLVNTGREFIRQETSTALNDARRSIDHRHTSSRAAVPTNSRRTNTSTSKEEQKPWWKCW